MRATPYDRAFAYLAAREVLHPSVNWWVRCHRVTRLSLTKWMIHGIIHGTPGQYGSGSWPLAAFSTADQRL